MRSLQKPAIEHHLTIFLRNKQACSRMRIVQLHVIPYGSLTYKNIYQNQYASISSSHSRIAFCTHATSPLSDSLLVRIACKILWLVSANKMFFCHQIYFFIAFFLQNVIVSADNYIILKVESNCINFFRKSCLLQAYNIVSKFSRYREAAAAAAVVFCPYGRFPSLLTPS